ncbi:MAG: UDP-N-acetylmuramoyl-L-alanine--D-glutamate ligase [Candidatus Dormibacteria bacterium]
MPRCVVRFTDLAGRRVGLWGLGREGRATLAILRGLRNPPSSILVATDTPHPQDRPQDVPWHHGEAGLLALRGCDVVIRSPGISRYREDALALRSITTTATDLWFAEHDSEAIIAVTGSKGKSTTASLIAHLLRKGGHRATLAGNIGIPMVGVTERSDIWVLELSSHQTSDLTHSPRTGVVTNLHREHIDWHGSLERYIADKLNLFAHRQDGTAVLNAADPMTQSHIPAAHRVAWFNSADGFRATSRAVMRGDAILLQQRALRLRGAHNLSNVAAALAAIDAAGIDTGPLLKHAGSFEPLRHRLESVGERDGVEYFNDSIATIPEAAIAACEALRDQPLTLLAGGFDRHQDHAPLVAYLSCHPEIRVIAMPPSGLRLAAELDGAGVSVDIADNLAAAVRHARSITPAGGVVLLSPAAPSYGLFGDFEQRGDSFRELAQA